MRPRDVLQMQTDLRTALLNPMWAETTDYMLASMEVQRRAANPLAVDLGSDAHKRAMEAFRHKGVGEEFIRQERLTLGNAVSFLVDEHMMPLIRMATADYPTDFALEPPMLPATDGFLVFDKSWETADVRGNHIRIKALTWRTVRGGVLVNEYSSLLEPDDVTEALLASSPEAYADMMRMGVLQFHHTYEMTWGSTLDQFNAGAPPEIRDAGVTAPAALRAIWDLMEQTFTDVRREQMTAKRRDGWKRKHIPGEVSVITLRRKAVKPVEHDGEVTYTHRWPVRGHWAWRWRGSERLGTRERHRVYIHPYLKGPDGAPIRETKHVTRLSR